MSDDFIHNFFGLPNWGGKADPRALTVEQAFGAALLEIIERQKKTSTKHD